MKRFFLSFLLIIAFCKTSSGANFSVEDLYDTCFGSEQTVLSEYFKGESIEECQSWFNKELEGPSFTILEFNEHWEEAGGILELSKQIEMPQVTMGFQLSSPISNRDRIYAKSFSEIFLPGYFSKFKNIKRIEDEYSKNILEGISSLRGRISSLEYSYNFLNYCYSDDDEVTFFLKEFISKYNFLIFSNTFFDKDQIFTMTKLRQDLHLNINISDVCEEIRIQILKNKNSYLKVLKRNIDEKSSFSILCGTLRQSIRYQKIARDSEYYRREKTSRKTPRESQNPLIYEHRREEVNSIDHICKEKIQSIRYDVLVKLDQHISNYKEINNLEKMNEQISIKKRLTIE